MCFYFSAKTSLFIRDQAAQGSGGVPVPGGVQKMRGCGTLGHGLAGVGVLG